MYNFFAFGQTKASELSEFPGVNTSLEYKQKSSEALLAAIDLKNNLHYGLQLVAWFICVFNK